MEEVIKKEKKFLIEEAIEFAWEKTKKYFWFFVLILLTTMAVDCLSSGSQTLYEKYKTNIAAGIGYGVLHLIFFVISFLISIGIVKISLKIIRKEEFKYLDIFDNFKYIINYFLSGILYFLIVVGGLILLIVPGIIWSIKFRFFPYFILEGAGPVEALKKSAKITNGFKWQLFFFSICCGVIIVMGFLALIVGLLWAVPVVWISSAYVFTKLSKDFDFDIKLENK